MKNNYLYRVSNIWGFFFEMNLLLIIIYSPFFGMYFYNLLQTLQIMLLVIILLFIEYLITYYSYCVTYIYEDKVEFVFPIRIYENTITIYFNEVDRIKLNSYGRGGPYIVFFKSSSEKWYYPWNSINCDNFNKRKEIMKFLDSKGLKIEIKSDRERDLKILN